MAVTTKLDMLRTQIVDLETRMANPASFDSTTGYAEAGRRYAQLIKIVDLVEQIDRLEEDKIIYAELIKGRCGTEERALLEAEMGEASNMIDINKQELLQLLISSQYNTEASNVIVEIKGAEGGEDANLFARSLLDMYLGYGRKENWNMEVLSTKTSNQRGITEAVVSMQGRQVWEKMKYEAGTHRVQRVPPTEAQGRMHTSSVTVSVLPDTAKKDEVILNSKDIRIDVYRGSGPGGQHRNTKDTAVRVTHLPTGTSVSIQDEKSQTQNKEKALQLLTTKLAEAERQKRLEAANLTKNSQIGSGGRGEKIRTYNFRDNRVTDHRTGASFYQLDKILAGNLDSITESLLASEAEEILAEYLE